MVSHNLARALWGIESAEDSRPPENVKRATCELRYQCHQDQQTGLRGICPGQIWSTMELVTVAGNRMRATMWRLSDEERLENFLRDVTQEHPVRRVFTNAVNC